MMEGDEPESQEKPWFVYLLATVQGPSRTYVGATVDVDRYSVL